MKKHPLILIVLGVLMALAGAVMSVTGAAPHADTKTIVACRERLRVRIPPCCSAATKPPSPPR